MRSEANADKVRRFMEALGRAARGGGRVYFTGGATAVLMGWRETTVDVDVRFDPEPQGVFEALPRLKDELDLNVELASPADFLPALAEWRERSRFIGAQGGVEFFHYDFRAQALAKIERGHARDLFDVRQMLARGLTGAQELRKAFQEIRSGLARFPAVDAEEFEARLEEFLSGSETAS